MSNSALLDRPAVEPPERSLTQRRTALKRANEIRTHRKGLKRDIKAGRERVVDVILDLDDRADRDLLETMKVWDLLLAAPKLGRVKVNKILVQARVSPSKTLAGLTRRQRSELAGLVGR
jgi:hypothetical protein